MPLILPNFAKISLKNWKNVARCSPNLPDFFQKSEVQKIENTMLQEKNFAGICPIMEIWPDIKTEQKSQNKNSNRNKKIESQDKS